MKVKLRSRIIMGYALITLIGLALGAIGIIGMQRMATLANAEDEMLSAYTDAANVLSAHYDWRHALIMAVSDGTEFTGSTDPTTCALGKWMAGDISQTEDPEMQRLLEQVRAPHDHIHRTAADINALLLEGKQQEALLLFETEVVPRTDETVALIGQAEAHYEDTLHAFSGEIDSVLQRELVFTWVAILLAVLLCVGLAALLMRSIMKPITEATHCAKKVAAGELDIQMAITTQDELGQMSDSFNLMIQSIHRLTSDVEELVCEVKGGDLSSRADESRHQGEYRKIIEGVNATVEELVEPIRETVAVLQDMAAGDLSTRIRGEYQGDYHTLQQAVNDTLEQIQHYIDLVGDSLGGMAGGDFDIEILEPFAGDFAILRASINTIAASMSDTLLGILTAANQVAAGTQQVSMGAQSVSQGATEQASSIQQISATMTELADRVQDTAHLANENSKQAAATREQGELGTHAMQNMQASMQEISEAAHGISRIIKVIDEIAFQTNILSLNAAVEAARAGAHGKGFAVVAEEVRNLAGKCAEAASETTALIEDTILKTEAGNLIARETSGALHTIVESVSKAELIISEIARASTQQAEAVSQTNKGMEEMATVVQSNSTVAEEAAAATQELASQAALLNQMVGRFRLKHGGVLDVGIRLAN